MTDNSTSKMIYDRLLTAGFGEDDFIEGVFLIEAADTDEFLQRRDELINSSEFCDPSLISYEEDEEGGLFKTIMEAYYTDVASIKKAWEELTEKHEWLFKDDSSILFEGLELWSDGKWCL